MQNSFSIHKALNRLVSITRFNRGEAAKIFTEVKRSGVKLVLKNNNPECFLVSPEEYAQMVEEIENYHLLLEAQERIVASTGKCLSEADVMNELGITEEDISDAGEVNLE